MSTDRDPVATAAHREERTMPAKYRKRPGVIEAAQWDGTPEGATPLIDWILNGVGTASYHDPDESPSFAQGRIAVQTQVDDSAASTVTATVTAVPVDGGILTPWGLLTYPPAARVGDVVRWTIRGGEVTVETYPPDD